MIENKKNNCGFTLIEMVLTMAIMVLLFGSIISIIQNNSSQTAITLEAQKLVALLRDQQNKALSGAVAGSQRSCSFGLIVNSSGEVHEYNYRTNSSAYDACSTSATQFTEPNPSYRFNTNKYTVSERFVSFQVPYGKVLKAPFSSAQKRFVITSLDDPSLTITVEVGSRGDITYY